MIVEKKTLKKIKQLGLNSYEAKIWTALLSRGVSTAGEIADIANVPRSRSYDVLESLEKKGFIIQKVGKPIQYIAVEPDEVIERVKKDVRREAEEQVDVLREFEQSSLIDELEELHEKGVESVDPTEIAGYLKGRTSIYDQMNALMKKANDSVLLSIDRSVEEADNDLGRAFSKMEQNDVSVKISAAGGSLNRSNVEVKNSGMDGRYMVVDSETVIFWITGEDIHPNYQTALWVDSEELAGMFEDMFLRGWSEGPEVETKLKAEVKKKAEQ